MVYLPQPSNLGSNPALAADRTFATCQTAFSQRNSVIALSSVCSILRCRQPRTVFRIRAAYLTATVTPGHSALRKTGRLLMSLQFQQPLELLPEWK